MITNNKILKIARSIKDIVGGDVQTPNDVYKLVVSQKNLKEYYEYLGPDNFIKLCISVWGLIQGYNLSQLEEIFDKVFFANVFMSDGDQYVEECDTCDGNGSISCDYCDGDGSMECSECGGTGVVDCDECDGTGSIEDDDGDSIECKECSGGGTLDCSDCRDGQTDCHHCDASGQEDCNNCDGSGQIESDEIVFDVVYIVCWSPKLSQLMELNQTTITPIIKESKFMSSPYLMIIGSDTGQHAELNENIDYDKVYCLEYFSTRPQTRFTTNGRWFFTTPSWDLEELEQ